MNTTHPQVQLLAHTMINREAIQQHMDIQGGSTDAETLTTFAGRACYQSFNRPNPSTYHDKDYLQRTLNEQNHWSIAEHATATLYFTGVSRSLTHELIRHRHLSYSQLSQRFVAEDYSNVIIPPAVENLANTPKGSGQMGTKTLHTFTEIAGGLNRAYTDIVKVLLVNGLNRKQAREAARAVLPNMTETRIVVTGNLRAWTEVINRRTQPDADAEIQHVMRLAHQQLHQVSPVLFPQHTHHEPMSSKDWEEA